MTPTLKQLTQRAHNIRVHAAALADALENFSLVPEAWNEVCRASFQHKAETIEQAATDLAKALREAK